MGRLLNASLLATAGFLGLVQAHDHNQAQGDNFAEAGSLQGVTGLPNSLGAGQCVEIDARQAGGQLAGLCIEINGGHSAGQSGEQSGGQKGGQNGEQNGGHTGGHNGGQNDGQRGQQGGFGAADGNSRTTLTEILTLGGTGSGNIHVSILSQATGIAATITRFTTVTTTVTVNNAPAAKSSSQAAGQLSAPSATAESSSATPAIIAAPNTPPAATATTPPVAASNNTPVESPHVASAAPVPAPAVGNAGDVVAGSGTPLADGTCNCMCLCAPGSFPLSGAAASPAAVSPQFKPTTLQTVASAAQGASSVLPAAITVPASTISLPASLVAATDTPTIPGSIGSTGSLTSTTPVVDPGLQSTSQAGLPLQASTIDSTTSLTTSSSIDSIASPTTSLTPDSTFSSSATLATSTSVSTSSTVLSVTTSTPIANGAAGSPAENTATNDSVDINTLTLTTNLVLGNLAQPTTKS